VTDPLRVALDVGPLYGHRTGVGEAVAGMHAALAARQDVRVDGYLVSFRSDARPGHRKLPLPGIVASHLWARADAPRADRWLGDAQVVHGTNYVAPPTRLATVVSVYDCWFLEHPELAAPVVRRAGRVLRRRVAGGAWVHTGSQATAQQARELLATDRVAVIPLGPPAPVAELADLPTPAAAASIAGRPFVLALGTQERRKDLPLLVTAFDRVATRDSDVLLVLAGAPGDASESVAQALAAVSAPARARVLDLGVVDPATKQWLLRQASVLAYPSLDEGFGFPILEAQSAGTPVVARAVGSIPEVAGDAAVLVTERSAEALADELSATLADTGRRLGLIAAGHRNVARFSWDSTGEALAGLYRTALEGR
jgi:glycosyltransferase involved in cell wall biosynthesis